MRFFLRLNASLRYQPKTKNTSPIPPHISHPKVFIFFFLPVFSPSFFF